MSYVRTASKMDEENNSPFKSINIDSSEKYRRLSGLVERNPELKFKRFKTDTEQFNLAFIGELYENCDNLLKTQFDENDIPTKQSFVKSKVGRPRKNKNKESFCIKESGVIPQTESKVKVKRNFKAKHNPIPLDSLELQTEGYRHNSVLQTEKNNTLVPEELNDAFVAENKKGLSTTRQGERNRKQRRWSGLFKRDLNIGFIEENITNDEEDWMNQELNTSDILDQVLSPKSEHTLSETMINTETSGTDNKTPIKCKLRNKPKKQLTEKEIIKYYTDKTVKKKQNTLETIFEAAKPELMSVRKYKRFINFNDRMSNVKVKKRHGKIRKYDLWENTQPLSMEYFLEKLEEVERDL